MTFCRIKKILEANGWCLVRIRGSHNQFRKAGTPYAVTVPDHGSRDITIGVIKDLEKKTGLSLRRQACSFISCNHFIGQLVLHKNINMKKPCQMAGFTF